MKKSISIIAAVFAAIIVLSACRQHASTVTARKDSVIVMAKSESSAGKVNWIGNWERSEWQEDASLDIKNAIGDSLVFELDAGNGGHTGNIEGVAYFKNNEAIFTSNEVKGCKLVMHMLGDSVINIADQNTCIGYGGMGVGFSGKFVSAKTLPKEKKQTLISLDILDARQDVAFRALVDTSYQRFVDCTQLIEDRTGEKPLDNFDAKVIASGVRGLYTYMEYIIMIDKQNQIWAAIINNNKVIYYTNSKDYINKLPNTIEDWRSGFRDYPVIYNAR